MFSLLGVLASSLTFLSANTIENNFLGNGSGLSLGRLEVDTVVQLRGLQSVSGRLVVGNTLNTASLAEQHPGVVVSVFHLKPPCASNVFVFLFILNPSLPWFAFFVCVGFVFFF